MMRSVFLVILTLLVLPSAPLVAYGEVSTCGDGSTYAYFDLETTGSEYTCHLIFGFLTPFLDEVRVVLVSGPVATVRFSLPDPPFGSVIGETWNYPFTGDRVGGMEMSIGDCPTGTVVLGTLTILSETGVGGGCLPWKVDDGCEAEDCGGVLRPSIAQNFIISDPETYCEDPCFQQCQSLPPYDLNPPDGATEVLPDVVFSWSGFPGVLDPALECYIRISTDPACNTGQVVLVPCDSDATSVDFLQQSTTYFWQAGWIILYGSGCSSGNSGESAIQSFTTSAPVAVERTTWSRVKALYRE